MSHSTGAGLPVRVADFGIPGELRVSGKKKDPPELTAGMEIGSKIVKGDQAQGVLGCFARVKGTTQPVILSCSHVIFPGFVAVPHQGIYQPKYSSCCSSGEKVATAVFDRKKAAFADSGGGFFGGYKDGKWFGGFNSFPGAKVGFGGTTDKAGIGSNTDCAIARLDPGVKFKNVWPDGTVIKGATPDGFGLGVGKGPKAGGVRPTKEQYVRVYTPRLNKVIYGTMLSHHNAAAQIRVTDPETIVYPFIIENSDDAESGIKPSIDQFLILPRPAPNEEYDEFKVLSFNHGDSGAIVINHENLVIGLISRVVDVKKLFPDPTLETATVDRLGVANVITFVLEQLNLEIPAAENGYSGTGPTSGASARIFVPGLPRDPQLDVQRGTIARLRNELQTSCRGRLLLGKIGQHSSEVVRLLTRVRAISSAWHQFKGPAFYAHCVRSAGERHHIIPTSINGIKRADLFDALLPLFAAHGSPELRRDIARYQTWALQTLLPIATLDDVPAATMRRQPVV
jgi:hypothetical protein